MYLSSIMKNIFNKRITGTVIGFIIIILLFILTSFFSQMYENEIKTIIGVDNNLSKLVYVLVTIFAIVFAPVSTMPLLPVASHAWGWIITGVLSIIGWVIGAQIAFFLARKFGKPLVEKFISYEKLHSFENYFTNKNLFWTIVFLRVILPVDVLSYALGLFSKVKSTTFFLATLVGITPFAFVFSYAGELSVRLQIIIFTEIVAIFGIFYIINRIIKNKKGE